MALAYYAPGVYREDVFVRPREALPTGVPGFVGFADVVPGAVLAANVPLLLNRAEELGAKLRRPKPNPNAIDFYLADAVQGFFANGGTRCYVAWLSPSDFGEDALVRGISALGALADLDLVAVPDAMSLVETAAAMRIQQAVLDHCRSHGNRFAILDTRGGAKPEEAVAQRRALAAGGSAPENAALYYPWVITGNGRTVPPCGHVAGIYARSDAATGVFKAPANEELQDVQDLSALVDSSLQEQLNPANVNCLRVFPGRGIRVWGARTLSDDEAWRYVSVRRLFLTAGRWIDRNMSWAAFEPNTPRLWIRIQRELSVYLLGLWRDGALKGASADQAFYVKCDVETNPADGRELGQVVTELGLAPLAPAEFVVVRVVQRQGGTDLS